MTSQDKMVSLRRSKSGLVPAADGQLQQRSVDSGSGMPSTDQPAEEILSGLSRAIEGQKLCALFNPVSKSSFRAPSSPKDLPIFLHRNIRGTAVSVPVRNLTIEQIKTLCDAGTIYPPLWTCALYQDGYVRLLSAETRKHYARGYERDVRMQVISEKMDNIRRTSSNSSGQPYPRIVDLAEAVVQSVPHQHPGFLHWKLSDGRILLLKVDHPIAQLWTQVRRCMKPVWMSFSLGVGRSILDIEKHDWQAPPAFPNQIKRGFKVRQAEVTKASVWHCPQTPEYPGWLRFDMKISGHPEIVYETFRSMQSAKAIAKELNTRSAAGKAVYIRMAHDAQGKPCGLERPS